MFLRLNFLIAVLPALALLAWFRRQDQRRPEPQALITRVVLWGVAITLPAGLLEGVAGRMLGPRWTQAQGSFLTAFLLAAVIEESLKLSVVLLYVWRKPVFDEVMDGILYTAAASLGFAVLENVLYSFGDPVVGLVRAVTAVPMHAVMSGIMGYFVGRAKQGRGAIVPTVAVGLLFAVLIHGTYDWAALSGGTFGFGAGWPLLGLAEAVGVLLVSFSVLRRLMRRALELDAEPVVEARPVQGGPELTPRSG